MADPLPSPADRPVVIPNRLGMLTAVSLAFNGLILLLILIGIIHHHTGMKHDGGEERHGPKQEYAENDGHRMMHHRGFGMHRGWDHDGMGPGCDSGKEDGRSFGDWHHGFHHDEGFGEEGHGFEHDQAFGGGEMNRGFGGPDFGGPGPGGHGFGDFGGGMGGHGFGGNPSGSEAMTDMLMLHLTQMLSLNDQQSSQIRTIVQQQITQFQKDMENARQAHQKMIDDAKNKIRPIPNADQQKQFDAMTARFGNPAPPAAPPAPPGK